MADRSFLRRGTIQKPAAIFFISISDMVTIGLLKMEQVIGADSKTTVESSKSILQPRNVANSRSRAGAMSIPKKPEWKTRLVRRDFPDRSFDIEFWQEQGDEAIFAAAWELVALAEEVSHGRKPTLHRTATALKRI